ncbi:O-methyltransferase ZRP4 [Citrus sinensis]|uniref:O-methyltransferase ZRP4 n=1 Tax=Citrus sinensis TaxID=2711 RepID=A0ACB8JNT0_CITSI|nr:O-methyltransferase ZRP4 [Citrus sinensis]
MTLKCSIQLGIPDIINKHGKPMTLNELVSALIINPSKTRCFFAQQKLVSSGNNNDEEQGYVLTNASKLLLKDNPLSEYDGDEPKLNNFFNEAMASDARLATSVMIQKCKNVFEGTAAKAIAKAFPKLECTCFDLPHVVNGLESDLVNLKYVGGDMFKAISPADAVVLKWILHDWNNEECVKILKKCKEAITSDGKKGKVIIKDMIKENKKKDDKSIETQLFFDMFMMKEWAKLFADAGFSDYKIIPILGLRSLIKIYPWPLGFASFKELY